MPTNTAKYSRNYQRKRYWRIRQETISRLGGKCLKCGSVEKLQVDHINPAEKKYDPFKKICRKYDELWKEIKKCQLLCGECHSKKTTLDNGKKIAKGSHGTVSTYRYCHCELCKQAKRDYMRTYRVHVSE